MRATATSMALVAASLSGGPAALALTTLSRPFVPSLQYTYRKGQHGRVAIVGGSEEYTGAPYYAGIAALKTGADLAHVLCARSASVAIKSYSPELIVHPVFGAGYDGRDLGSETAAAEAVLARADSVVFGPGLGRDPGTMRVVSGLIRWAATRGLPTVLDGDALWLLSQVSSRAWPVLTCAPKAAPVPPAPLLLFPARQDLSIIRGHGAVVLTPNGGEFARLWAAAWAAAPAEAAPAGAEAPPGLAGAAALAARLASVLGSAAPAHTSRAAGEEGPSVTGGLPSTVVAVLRKGHVDAVAVEAAAATADVAVDAATASLGRGEGSAGLEVGASSGSAGSPRRCGGQGDVLAGVLGIFLAWAARDPGVRSPPGPPPEALLACAGSASRVTRAAAAAAFAAHGRATTTPDLIALLGAAFQTVHPD